MEDKIKIEKTNVINSYLRYIYIVMILVSISLWISVGLLKARHKEENIVYLESTVHSVWYDEDEEDYLFKINDCEYIFKVSDSFIGIPNLCNELIQEEYIKVHYYQSTTKYDEVIVVSIEERDRLLVDLGSTFTKQTLSIGIAASILTFNAIFLFIIDLMISKNKYYKTYVYFEYYAKALASNTVNYNGLSFEEQNKKTSKSTFIFFFSVVLLCIAIAIFGSLYPDLPHVIIPIAVAIMIVMIYYLFKSCGFRLYKEKDIYLFIERYFNYLNKDENYKSEYHFNKDEFLYSDYQYDDEYDCNLEQEYVNFSYDEMKFFAYCFYNNKFQSAYIYICSDKKINGYSLIIPLLPIYYQEIKKNNVYIEGLDYLLSNLKEEIILNHKNKIKYKSYKNY